ncbi:hypothetical protein JCM15519_26420 [Fundidesulfovibrio butyratiphilus]
MVDPMLTASDLDKEERKRCGEGLVRTLHVLFDRLRLELEREDLQTAQGTARALAADLARLDELVSGDVPPPAPTLPPLPESPDALAMQAFRRKACAAFEHFSRRLDALKSGPWRSRVDTDIRRAVSRQRFRHGLALAGVALIAGLWFWSQQSRIHAQELQVNQAKAQTAMNTLKFLSLAAWQAQNTSGKTLNELVRDMNVDCAGIDINASLPNSPCREDWVFNREALFTRFIPPPGETKHAPGEIYFDPWGGPYLVLIQPGRLPRIACAGPSGRLGDPGNLSVDVPYWPVGTDAPNKADTKTGGEEARP